jgi:hypothetical protein
METGLLNTKSPRRHQGTEKKIMSVGSEYMPNSFASLSSNRKSEVAWSKVKPCLPPCSLMAFIFLISSIPGEADSGALKVLMSLDPQWQNLLHIPLFGLLQTLWLRAFARMGRSGRAAVLTCLGISLAYGVCDEFHQLLVPGRYASLLDMGLNLVGVSVATLVFVLWNRSIKGAEG